MAAHILKQCFRATLLNRVLFTTNKCFLRKTSDIICSPLQSVQIPDLTIPEFVFQNFSFWPDKTAVECSVTGKKFSFEKIRKKSINLGNGLRTILKLKEGDVIAVVLPNVPEYPISVLGALHAGLTVTTINPTHMPHELKRQFQETQAKAIITLNTLWITVQVAIKDTDKNLPILTIKMKNGEDVPAGAINFEEFTDTEFEIQHASRGNPTDVALIPFSCGTTRLPRGIDLTHQNIVANLCQINAPYLKSTYKTTYNFQDVVLDMTPWSHIYGLTAILFNHLYNLCKIVSLPQLLPKQYVTTLAKHKPSILHVHPSIVAFMSIDSTVKKDYLQPLRTVTSVKGTLESVTEEKFLEKAGKYISMLQVYGLTETASSVIMTSRITKRHCNSFGSVGEILPNTLVKIIPIDGMDTKCGELFIKGPQVMKGFHNNPKETESAFVDGWLRTEDVVYYDVYKRFYIKDRLCEMIHVDKFKVASTELQEIIKSHPCVLDAAVIGIPHCIHGEVPRAYVVLKPGEIIDVSEIQEFVDDQLVSYKNIEGGITIVDYLPKTVFGNVLKRRLQLEYLAEENSIYW